MKQSDWILPSVSVTTEGLEVMTVQEKQKVLAVQEAQEVQEVQEVLAVQETLTVQEVQ